MSPCDFAGSDIDVLGGNARMPIDSKSIVPLLSRANLNDEKFDWSNADVPMVVTVCGNVIEPIQVKL